MLTLLPVTDIKADTDQVTRVPLLAAVGVTARGGVAVVGWSGAVDGEMRQQVRELLDDPAGVVRVAVLMVPVLANDTVRAMLGRKDHG